MADLKGLGAVFDPPALEGGFGSSQSGGPSSSLANSAISSKTSLSLASDISLPHAVTHDTSQAQYHMKHLERFVEDLQASVQRAFPNNAYSRYEAVEVLLIRWEEDELDVDPELHQLQFILRNGYRFSTEVFLIPTQNSHRKLMSKALTFVDEHEGEDTLLIVYYGGHGSINKARQSTWSCKRDQSYASVEWSAIQTLFEQSRGDVLLLLDCCAGASAAPNAGRADNITETIAACGFETWAPRPGKQSFTSTLIDVLGEWASGPPFSAAMLHSEILTRLKHEQPQRNAAGERVESRRTPTYIVSTTDANAASVTLSQLVPREAEVATNAIPGSFPASLMEPARPDKAALREERLQSLLALDENGQRKVPHVLLSVALEEDQVLDVASCSRWLKNFPLLAKHVSIEGVYRGYSTLLILSVPVVLWDVLPDHLATRFIGYVRSPNLRPTDDSDGLVSAPIPITGPHLRRKTVAGFDDELMSGPTSGMSSLDSGYASASIATSDVASPMAPYKLIGRGDVAGRFRGSLPPNVLTRQRQPRHVTELLGDVGSRLSTATIGPSRLSGYSGDRLSKRLVVRVEKADLYHDRRGQTCVLWYGHEVQRSELLRRATQVPEWNEEFCFQVYDSPMFNYLRLSVWGGQMLELIGETYIDLRSLVKDGKVPDLDEWHNLRSDGRTTGVIRLSLKYLHRQQQQIDDSKKAGGNDKRAREDGRRDSSGLQGMDVRVW